MSKEYRLAKYACYAINVSMSAVCNLSALLFVTFRQMYEISYTLLGLLVVVNFSTQLIIDLIFSFFSKYFNIHKTIRIMPVVTVVGLLIYGIMPSVFPSQAYLWIFLGTIIFSVSAGLGEVLMSPLVAAIPSDNPEREMSKLHSMYAWGVVVVVIISTLFLKIVGTHNWKYLAIFWAVLPLCSAVMFFLAKLPEMKTEEAKSEKGTRLMSAGVLLCMACIFLGGASECTMTQWISGFMETAVGVPKIWGDIFGVAVFAAFLGLGRTLYAKYGKNIINIMLLGMAGASLCYVVAGVSLNPFISLIACVMTGFCTSMLWPGTIIYIGEKIPSASIAIYALMAAGGDAGASLAPQLVGIIADKLQNTAFCVLLSDKLAITAEQVSMRIAVLSSAVFPILGVFLICIIKKYFKSEQKV